MRLMSLFVACTALLCLPAHAGLKEARAAYEAKDYSAAYNEWKVLAEQGNVEAQFRLADLYLAAEGVLFDPANAMSWYAKAAAQGYPRAQAKLGMIYSEGKFTPADWDKSFYWYGLAANNGDIEAQVNLADAYSNGKGTVKNAPLALRWMEQAARGGNAISQYNLGLWYSEGRNVARDDERARYWYLQAATQGNAGAQHNLALALKDGTGGPVDLPGAFSWLHKAADQDFSAAQCELGNAYAMGQGVPRDYIQAVYWYQKAADQGLAKAQANLGLMYSQGTGVPQNGAMAARYYQLAADQGMVEVQTALGSMYYLGHGVKQDYAKALKWFRRAAAQGNLAAYMEIGSMYENGAGVARDDAEAESWYHKAADQGHREAQNKLAALLARRQKVAAPAQAQDETGKLFALVRQGDLAGLQQALATGSININEANEVDATLLEAAIEAHRADVATYLIEHGADANRVNSTESTPVMFAAYYDMPELIPLLKRYGADLDRRNNNGQHTALSLAANTGNLKVVQVLLQLGADPDVSNVHNVVPLAFAISGKHKEMAQLLLEHSKSVDVVSVTYEDLLSLAAENEGWSDIVQGLLARGAKCGIERNTHKDIDSAADIEIVRLLQQCIAKTTGEAPELATTLANAARHGNAKFVGELADAGADVNGSSSRSGAVPLIEAMLASNSLEVVRVLIDKGADPNHLGGNGTAALHELGRFYKPGMAPVVDYLIAHGADVNLHDGNEPSFGAPVNPGGDTPLHYAASNAQREYVEVLLAHGAQIDEPGHLEKTPLAEAIEHGHTDVAALLLAHGADINAKGHESFSPLWLAVRTGQESLVEFVLQHGADVNYRGFEGDRPKQSLPLSEAALNGSLGIAKLLLAHGADPGLVTPGRMDTPLHNAIGSERLDIMKAFFEKKAGLTRQFDLVQLADEAQDDELRAYLLAKAGKSRHIAEDAAFCRGVATMEDAGRFGQPAQLAKAGGDGGLEKPAINWEVYSRGEPKRVVLGKTAYWLWRHNGRLATLVVAGKHGPGRTVCTFTRKGTHTVVADAPDRVAESPERGKAGLASSVIRAPGLAALKQFLEAARHDKNLAKWNSADGRDYLLLSAAQDGRSDMVSYLLGEGAAVNRTFDQIALDGLNADKSEEYQHLQAFGATATPLLLAVESGNEDSVRALLDHGADPNRSYKQGQTTSALASVAAPSDVSMMELLLRRGALPGSVGEFKFDEMIDWREQEGIRLLLEYGLDRIDVGHQDGHAMQLSEKNRKNPDAVDMILRMHPVEWQAACHLMPADKLSDQCLPTELRNAVLALDQARAHALEAADAKRRRTLTLEAKAWDEKLQKVCRVKARFEPRDGWYATILGDRAAATCTVDMMRRIVPTGSK